MKAIEEFILQTYPIRRNPANGKKMSKRQLEILSRQLEKNFSQMNYSGKSFVLKWILYFDTLPTPVAQRAACKWFCNRSVFLPEDEDKILQAVNVAKAHHVDPLSYDYPMAIINAFGNYKRSGRPINPDTVPTLHLNHRYENGLDIYDVEENDESRINMRSIINTHWGIKCNPWCLLQGDGNGNLTQRSGRYWKHYNGFPKRVAFKDGHLYAFSAGTGCCRVWWDRNDRIIRRRTLKIDREIENDPLHRRALFKIDSFTGETAISGIYRGSRQWGTFERYKSIEDKEPYSKWYYLNGERIFLTKRWKGLSAARVREMIENSDISQGIIRFPDGIKHIPDGFLKNCIGLKELYLPDSVESIGERAFEGCTSLWKIHLPSQLKTITNMTFWNCRTLREINIPTHLEKIGASAFQNCASIQSISLPEAITHIPDKAFSGCISLEEIIIPKNLTTIAESAFSGCQSLRSLNLPNTTIFIGKAAFSGCSSLKEIKIPNTIKFIHGGAFSLCTSVTRFYVPARWYPMFCERYGRRVHFLSELQNIA